MSFISPVVNTRTTLDVTMEVNPGQSPAESTYTDNTVTGAIDALDVRADLSIASQNIYVQSSGGNITGEEFGRVVTINALIVNLGGRPVTNFQVQLGWNNSAGYNRTLLVYPFANISAVAGNHTTLITFSWMINITTPGLISIWVLVDAPDSIDEPDENNNFAANAFTINELDMNIAISTAAQEYGIGDSIVVTVTFTYTGSNVPVKGLPGVQLSLYNTATRTVAPGSATGLLWTNNETGKVSVSLIVPSTIESGTYKVQVEVTSTGDIERSDTDLQITGAVEGGMFPWWFWIVIIIVAAAGVGGAFIYTYVYGLGKLVECGECGAFISAAEKRCPKCGVEFEVGTMKCSECGAWIPAESAECPNCGVKFVGEVEEEKDYLERMRKEYEDMVSKYRELAKVELGKKFSEKNFQEWWTRQPAFISFEDWLAKEEEKKKEGPVPCPVCGTLNPKEATVCHKCGTVFGAPRPAGGPSKKGPPPAAPPAAGGQQEPAEAEGQEEMPPTQAAAPAAGAPRMVIRRPIDRKVIPKKIIKTPTGEERTEGEENQ
jgi:ribosomal protein L40E